MRLLESGRRFRLWEFRVSHNQLLVRSPRNDDAATNTDVVFTGVVFMELPTDFDGLRIAEGDSSRLDRIPALEGRRTRGMKVYILTSAGREHLIVAASATVSENELDLFESSLESFSA